MQRLPLLGPDLVLETTADGILMLRNIQMPLMTRFLTTVSTLFSKMGLCLALSLMAALTVAMPASAAELMAKFVEGTHYLKISTPVPTEAAAAGQVEVTEVFSYGCIHCYNFDPMVDAWHKAQDDKVIFRRMPAVFNQSWAVLAQAFYTAEALGVSERMHAPLFRAIHDQPINISDPELMARLFKTEAGVSADDFNAAFESFGVRGKVQQAQGQGRAFRLRAVPSIVVDGKYLIDSSMVGGGNAEMLEVADFLVARTLAQQGATQ